MGFGWGMGWVIWDFSLMWVDDCFLAEVAMDDDLPGFYTQRRESISTSHTGEIK